MTIAQDIIQIADKTLKLPARGRRFCKTTNPKPAVKRGNLETFKEGKMAQDLNAVAEDMFQMVESAKGDKKYKPSDLFKAMIDKYKDNDLSKKDCKSAIRVLIDSGRLVYTYFNGTFVEIPGIEGAAMAAEEAKKKSV